MKRELKDMKKALLTIGLLAATAPAFASLDKQERLDWETCAGIESIVQKWDLHHMVDVSPYPEMDAAYRESASKVQIKRFEKDLKKFNRQVNGWYKDIDRKAQRLGLTDQQRDLYVMFEVTKKYASSINVCF